MIEAPSARICDITIQGKDSASLKSAPVISTEWISQPFTTWLHSFGLNSVAETPECCHERYIGHGYRPSPSTWLYCLQSAFHPTNETLNVWTHAIPCLLMLRHYWNFSNLYLDDVTNPILYPYWFFAAGVMVVLLGSSCAHLFNCLSYGAREVCFCCDYGVIALQAIGLTCSFTFYLCPYSCIKQWPGIFHVSYVTIMVGNVSTVAISCLTRYPAIPHRNLLRVLSYVIMYIALNIPCVYRYSSASSIAQPNNLTFVDLNLLSLPCNLATSSTSANYFNETCLVMLLGAIIQALKIPERWLPGFFDIVGHSHQLFHLLTACGLYYQSLLIEPALLEALQLNRAGFLQPEDLQITWFTSVLVPTTCAVLSCAAAIYYSVDLHKSHSKVKSC
ncbi:unnamed protein product [Clavelina lepadiformis]